MRANLVALTALTALTAVACTTQAPPPPPPPPIIVPMMMPPAEAPPTAASRTTSPKPPRPPPEPLPPAPVGAKPDLVARDIDLTGETVTFDLVNRGGALPPGSFGVEVVVSNRSGEGRPITIDKSIPGGLDATTSAVHQIEVVGIGARFPRLATEGGQLEVRIALDTAGSVDESDETNNIATEVVPFDATVEPIVAPPHVDPIPASPPSPAVATTAEVTFRRSDDAWANVWVDGQIVFACKNFEKEGKVTLTAGKHRLKVEDFMGSSTWSEGTLTVVGGNNLVVGFAENKPFDVYSDPGAFVPL